MLNRLLQVASRVAAIGLVVGMSASPQAQVANTLAPESNTESAALWELRFAGTNVALEEELRDDLGRPAVQNACRAGKAP